MQRFLPYLLVIFISVLSVILQFSFVSALPWPWYSFNLPVTLLVIFLFSSGNDYSVFFAFFSGLLLDILSFYPFGAGLLSLVSSAIFLKLMLDNWLTNRSLYTFLLLGTFGSLIYVLLFRIFSALAGWSGASFLLRLSFWESLFWSVLLSVFVIFLFFHLLTLFNRNLQPFFLKGKSSRFG